jgi:DNA helicase-2/ATP-dependent DNA helicase PcrA
VGYPRFQSAPPTLPHIEAQKAALDARAPRDALSADPSGRRRYTLRPPVAPRGASARIRAELDPEQLAAVEAPPGRVLVLAAAGSGKTRTIAYRLAHLVETGTDPQAVLLVTFTRRAAREMTRRAERASGRDLSGMTAGTFHAVAQRILRRYGPLVGLPRDFTILDQEDQADLMAVARDRVLGGRDVRPVLPKPGVLAGMAAQAAEQGRPVGEVAAERNPRLADRLDLIEEVAAGYAEAKARMAAVDYGDLMGLAIRLLDEQPRVRDRLAARFRCVLVDEVHDASARQVALAEALAGHHGHLVLVADPDQSIYSWRGADPGLCERLAGTPGTRVLPLSTNYRARPELVAFAQATLPGGNRFGKRLRAARPAGGLPPVVVHLASVEDEAAFVTQRIGDLLNDGRDPGEIGVLYRAHHHSVDLQLALAAAGVEIELYSGARFVESAHVKDVLAFLRLRHNPRDDLAWHRALRLFAHIGRASAARVVDRVRGTADPLRAVDEVRLGGAAGEALGRFRAAIAPIREMDRPEAIVAAVGRSEWYRDHLQRTYPNWRDREGDIARLAELGARAPTLERFLADLQLAERVEADEDVSGPARRVALTTVHQAKGLEWPVVFVLQVEAGSFPSGWAVSEGRLDEEERLFHVAVTRAADELYLCRPILARRPWDTGADAVVINSGRGFLDRDLDGLVEEWTAR